MVTIEVRFDNIFSTRQQQSRHNQLRVYHQHR